MRVLFVNSCCRGAESRTLRLAEAMLDELKQLCPEAEIVTHDLYAMQLHPMDAALLAVRERLCNGQDWSHPMIDPALDFQRADMVVIAAPYWDLSFPAALKTWVENMWVRNLTFVYRNDLPVGLCRGRACVYITTSGSLVGTADFGTEYIREVMKTLGIPGFVRVSAEGLDCWGADVDARMEAGERSARLAAKTALSLCKTDPDAGITD